jgi:hypothetical protein
MAIFGMSKVCQVYVKKLGQPTKSSEKTLVLSLRKSRSMLFGNLPEAPKEDMRCTNLDGIPSKVLAAASDAALPQLIASR